MLNKFFITIALALSITTSVSAEMMLFTSAECSHCQDLKEYLSTNDLYKNYDIMEYELFDNEENKLIYLEKSKELNYTAGGVPLLINGEDYIEGNNPIREYLATRPQIELEKFTLTTEDQSELKEILDEQSSTNNKNGIVISIIIVIIIALMIKRR